MRFLFYSHDGLGLGHTRRNLAIAEVLTTLAPDASVLLASGVDDVGRMHLPHHVEVLKLPGLRKLGNSHYISRRLKVPTQEIRAIRSALLLAAVQSFRPNVMLVDKHPFGAGGEIYPALTALRDLGGHAILGLRDILDDRDAVLAEWLPDLQIRIPEFYDLVLIYGERSVFDPVSEYRFSFDMASRTRFCGYVVSPDETQTHPVRPRLPHGPKSGLVLATAGGGEDGFSLFETFIETAATAPWKGIMVTGPMTPENEFRTLQRLARRVGVSIHQFVPSLGRLLDSVDALVSMGGYNTLVEAVSKGVPIVCVPRVRPRTEQLIRSQLFERMGLLRTLPPSQLNPENLTAAVQAALTLCRQQQLERVHSVLNFEGATHAATHLLATATNKAAGLRAMAEIEPE